jgi:Protein kinase domain
MRTDRKRSALPGGSLLAIGLAVGAAGLAQRLTSHAQAPDLAAPARQVQARVNEALGRAAAGLEPEAAKAGHIPALTAAWKMGADRTTLQDLLENEDWWVPFRTRFALSGVVPPSGPVAALGPPAGDLGGSEIVRRARESGSASGLLAIPSGAAFLAAASRVAAPRGAVPAGGAPIVLVATPLDQTALQGVAGLTGDIVGLSDGAKLLAATGPETSRRFVAFLIGRENQGAVGLEGGRVGVAWPLGAHLWFLGVSPPGALPAAPPAVAGLWLVLAGAAFTLAGLIALALRSRPLPGPTFESGAGVASTSDAGLAPGGESQVPRTPPVGSSPAVPGTRAWGMRPAEEVGEGPGEAHAPTAVATSTAPGAASTAAVAASAVPGGIQEMGRYRLIERIGEGGMAEIFFAAAYGAEDFVRHFVLKRLHPHLARHREVVNQFIDEARLQSGLVHSNIVPVFDFGKAGEEYYLALEYIHGRDVGQIVQRHVEQLGRPLPLPVAFFILHEVLDALGFSHAQTAKDGSPMNIVHRDVAPGNVLVSYRGEVKLTDFGIAKGGIRVSRTEVGMVKGNVSFMSPEQARGETVDRRSDIFSAGLVFYYCLTGQVLYAGDNAYNRLIRAAVGPVTAEFSLIEALPPEATQILRRALAFDPAKRYESAVEFERDVTAGMGRREDLAQVLEVLFPASERRDLR